jgi:predicted nucleic acid-binding Zn ribbon protein
MPTYVYRFVDTGETIEVQQAFTDDALTEAAHPGSGAVSSRRSA